LSPDLEPWQKAWLGSRDNPYLFATGVLGFLPAGSAPDGDAPILEAWQDKFLREFTDSPRHSVRAGHGVGKGTVIAVLALWFPLTHYDSKCVLTANSQDQLRDNNWPEIRKWHRRLPEALRDQIQIDEERLYIRAQPEMAFVVRRTASKHNPEALQGIHAKYVLYLVDEASGIDDIVFEVAQGSLSTEGALAALFSNPTRATGFFHATHTTLRGSWKTWRVSSEDVPRARGHIDDIIKAYGKDSNRYRVRVMGEFPTKADDVVIPLEWVEAAKGRKVTPSHVYPVWGVDVARFGDDRTALVKRQGNTLLGPPLVWRDLDNAQVVGRIMFEYEGTPNDDKPKAICVDAIGLGAGVADFLRNNPVLLADDVDVIAVNVSEASSVSELHMRKRDELWWMGRQWFEAKDCHIPQENLNGDDLALIEELISELTTPTYDHSASGKIVVISKADMKKELGRSPDIADALLNTWAASTYPRPTEKHRRYRNQDYTTDPWAS
jgi:phage terminase large subunit